MPLLTAVRRRRAVSVESTSDGTEGVAAGPQATNAPDDGLGYEDRSAQLDPSLLRLGQPSYRALADDLPFPLRDAHNDVGHQTPVDGKRIDAQVVASTPYPGSALAAEAPKITDWMQAWGSLAGLVMSTAAVIFTGLLFRHEIRVRRDEQHDSEAAQARLVVAQIVGLKMSGTDERSGQPTGRMVAVRWRIKNHSQAPIFDAVVSIDEWTEDRWGEVIEGETSGMVECDPPLPFDYGPYDPREALVKVEFTDAAGLRWVRQKGEPPERVIFQSVKHTGLKRWLPFLRRGSSEFDSNPPF